MAAVAMVVTAMTHGALAAPGALVSHLGIIITILTQETRVDPTILIPRTIRLTHCRLFLSH
jgi:hypothetical protein